MKPLLTAIPILLLLLFGCNNKPADKSKPDAGQKAVPATPETAPESKKTGAGTYQLLQGKWQHVEDTTNYLVFEGDHRKEIAAGLDQWDDEPFVLADKCVNPSDKTNGTPPEKDKYISCPQSDLCWYIESIDQENLSLSYMGRGNTLTYRRVQ